MATKRQLGAGRNAQNTEKENFARQLLIDTLPIRIASKSFPYNKWPRSNRHSSGTLTAKKAIPAPRASRLSDVLEVAR